MKSNFHVKYSDKIKDTISCYDRILINGSLSQWGYAESMRSYLFSNKIKVFDFPAYAKTFNERIRQQIEKMAEEHQVKIEHIRSPNKFNKELNIKNILKTRGMHPGIVHIYTSMEICDSYSPCWNKTTGYPTLKLRTTKCLHYYIYLIDSSLGLCFIKIQTWIPCRVQFYFNGHNYLANKLKKKNIDFKMEDNAFVEISDSELAQELSDNIRVEKIKNLLDIIVGHFIPFLKETSQSYRWTILQAEYSTDVIFKNQKDFRNIYEEIVLQNIHCAKPENIATFFSRPLAAHYSQEVGTKYNKMIQGTRIKHHMGANSIKMYDKSNVVLRIETTVNDIKEFKVFRDVTSRSGETVRKYAPLKKNIFSLHDLIHLCTASNNRYLEFIAAFGENSEGKKNLHQISQSKYENNRSYKGFNFFDEKDYDVLLVLSSGEFVINGFRNKSIRKKLKFNYSPSQISRILKRLHLHGLIKKVKNSFKYYITDLGRKSITAGLVVKETNIIPALN